MTNLTEMVPLSALRPHPRNYKRHPDEQLDHIIKSIDEHGFYRNVVVARDGTILAGHGVCEAVAKMGLLGPELIPIIRLPIDPEDPRALKVLAGDNEIGKMAEADDRALTELLRDVATVDDLLGTGFDEQNLAALLYNTRPKEEVEDMNDAAEWVGLPAYEEGEKPIKLVITFPTEAHRLDFVTQMKLRVDKRPERVAWNTRWPWTDRVVTAASKFEAAQRSLLGEE